MPDSVLKRKVALSKPEQPFKKNLPFPTKTMNIENHKLSNIPHTALKHITNFF
jgi:hypothetical protein